MLCQKMHFSYPENLAHERPRGVSWLTPCVPADICETASGKMVKNAFAVVEGGLGVLQKGLDHGGCALVTLLSVGCASRIAVPQACLPQSFLEVKEQNLVFLLGDLARMDN